MTNDEAIKLLSQIMDVLLASNSWLPSTKNPIKESFGMAINALTAQRTGRWIHDGCQFKGGIDWMHCSECGHKDNWNAVRTPFCAWCGARMDETNESDCCGCA